MKVGCIRVTHPYATLMGSKLPNPVRLACIRPAASVHPEPGSNSPLYNVCLILTLVNINYFLSRIGMILIRICLLVVCYLFKELYGFPLTVLPVCCRLIWLKLNFLCWSSPNRSSMCFCLPLSGVQRCNLFFLFANKKFYFFIAHLSLKSITSISIQRFSLPSSSLFLPSLAGCKGNHLFRFSKSFLNFFKTFLFILLLPLLLSNCAPYIALGSAKVWLFYLLRKHVLPVFLIISLRG